VQACDVTGAPPVQPAGEEVRTVRVCVEVVASHALHAEYVNALQVPPPVDGGVHACDVTGEPPVQPAGEEASTVRVCVPVALQALQPE
jgi:hypothetical protein